MSLDDGIDAVFGFVWRWFWRIVGWGALAIAALFVLFMAVGWANEHPGEWISTLTVTMLGIIAGLMFDVRRLLQRLVEQNDRAPRRSLASDD